MKKFLGILLLLLPLSLGAKDFDVSEVVFGHIGDAYEWHVAKIGQKDIVIWLPVIVRTRWAVACLLFKKYFGRKFGI